MTKRSTDGFFTVENVKTIVYAALIAIGIRTVAFEPFNIPSGSMIPTLLVGDYLFVSKFSYGYSRYSMPMAPDLFRGRIFGSLPRRGDVAVFKFPLDPSQDYIKRIVGLPGDHIQVKAGKLYVNGAVVPLAAEGDVKLGNDARGPKQLVGRYIETLPGSNGGPPRRHAIIKETFDALSAGGNNDINNTPEYLIPEGSVFGMGDNRDNSADSRVFGLIPVENLVGRAEFLFFSIEPDGQWWEFWRWPSAIRWSRLFSAIT
jgi:signal peptidase I